MTASATTLRGMARIEAGQFELASAVTVPPDVLADWYRRQFAHQRAYLDRLEAAMKQAHADPRLNDREHEGWKKYWALDARYRYAFETFGLLARREHVLVCPVDGIPDVSDADWAEAMGVAPTPDQMANWKAGLSLRGLLTGEPRFAWERYSESIAPEVERTAKKLYADWRGAA